MRPEYTQKVDSEYIRNVIYSIFVFVEPLGGVRHVSVREHCTAWAKEIRYLVDVSFSALSFPAVQVCSIAKRLEMLNKIYRKRGYKNGWEIL